MAYKIKNPYEDCHIMDLNTMDIRRKIEIGFGEVALLASLIIAICVFMAISAMPEFGFLAECQNIPGGDICHISIK